MTERIQDRMPTQEEVDELLALLPVFSAPDYQPVLKWHGGETKDKVMHVLWPEYDEAVDRFIEVVHKDCWIDRDYVSADVPSMLVDESRITTAGLREIKSMLTFCVRGERFCDGHLGDMIEGGYVTQILERLATITQHR